jgi:hypothetical protein
MGPRFSGFQVFATPEIKREADRRDTPIPETSSDRYIFSDPTIELSAKRDHM